MDGIPIAVIDATSNTKDDVTLQHACQQAVAHVVEDNDDFKERVGSTPNLENFL